MIIVRTAVASASIAFSVNVAKDQNTYNQENAKTKYFAHDDKLFQTLTGNTNKKL